MVCYNMYIVKKRSVKEMTDKKTKKVLFAEVLEMVKTNDELKIFIENEIDLVTKKNATKSKADLAKEAENADLVKNLKDHFVDKPFTITEASKFVDKTTQKITALMTKLEAEKKAVRTVVKSVIFYAFVD